MLDKNARKVLKYFIKTRENQDKYTIACNVKLTNDENKLLDLSEIALDDLLETNCIKNTKWGYQLTSFGKMYFKKSLKDNFYRYFYPILTAAISLVLSLILK